MATSGPEVRRIRDYPGTRRQSAQGGSGIEFYAVYELGPEEIATAQGLSPPLPKIGSFSPDPRLAFMGTVQAVDIILEMGPLGFICRVTYSVGGTFSFSLKIGSRDSGTTEWIRLPVIGKKGTSTFYSITPLVTWPRCRWTRAESTKYVGDVDAAADLIRANVGRFYAKRSHVWINDFGGARPTDSYRLTGANITTDASNNTRIDTYFASAQPLPAYPVNTFAGQKVAIPELPSDCLYSDDSDAGTIVIVDPFAQLPPGETLPWLP